MMWKQEMVITEKVDGGVIIAAEKPTYYNTKPGHPSERLLGAGLAVWEVMEQVAGFRDAGDSELVGQLYGAVCQLASLAKLADAEFEEEAKSLRMDEEFEKKCREEEKEEEEEEARRAAK
jgi:hypothetical protein